MKILYITDPVFSQHEMSPGHPESPARLAAIESALRSHGLWGNLTHTAPEAAIFEHLLRVHERSYIDFIFANAPRDDRQRVIDPDTSMNRYTLTAALKAAGAVVKATDAVLANEADGAFCAVRPPGHHAERDRAMGFCFFNNVAVGAAHALEKHGLQRVAIVDFDVHHGNGTQDIFRDDPRVLFCSTHQHPLYPFTGERMDAGHIVNVPLPSGADGALFRDAISREWLPRLNTFKPEMIFISAGFDAHRDDPLAEMNLVEEDFYWVTRQLIAVAEQHCQRRIVSTLEGGYNLKALGNSVAAHVQALMDE